MFFGKRFVHSSLLFFCLRSSLFLRNLSIEFLLDQSSSLLLAGNCLLLLLVMEKGIEFFDGSPFVLLCQFAVDLSSSRHTTWCNAHLISLFYAVRLGAASWTCNRLNISWLWLPISLWSSSSASIALPASCRGIWLAIIKNGLLFISQICLFWDFWV